MDKTIVDLVKKPTDHFEQFLKECKSEGDTTIDDVLKRIENLKKET